MKAMILAAGYGRRLRPLTDHTPKPLLAVRGKSLIERHLEHLHAAGIREVVINCSWLADKLEAALGDGSRFGVSISWSREVVPLETGGGIKQALPLLVPARHSVINVTAERSFLVISGDTWTDYPLAHLCAHNLNDALAHLVMVPNPTHNPEGDFRLDSHGRLGLKRDGAGSSLTYTGLALIDRSLFDDADGYGEVFPLREVLRSAIVEGRVTGELYRGLWSDVGTVERLQALNRE